MRSIGFVFEEKQDKYQWITAISFFLTGLTVQIILNKFE